MTSDLRRWRWLVAVWVAERSAAPLLRLGVGNHRDASRSSLCSAHLMSRSPSLIIRPRLFDLRRRNPALRLAYETLPLPDSTPWHRIPGNCRRFVPFTSPARRGKPSATRHGKLARQQSCRSMQPASIRVQMSKTNNMAFALSDCGRLVMKSIEVG